MTPANGKTAAIGVPEISAFAVLLGAHLLAALFTPIQDCDETFNFWEPSHYLNHGYGLQTWELSPEYAIRSWLYASIHSLFIRILNVLSLSSHKKTVEFFGLRCGLALTCAICETRLFRAIYHTINPRIAIIFVTIISSSAGMFHASASYLPSSFVMYTTMLALANVIDNQDGNKTTRAIVWLALGTIVGWPFVAVLSSPLVLYEISEGIANQDVANSLRNLTRSVVYSLLILLFESAVDTFFYQKLTSVPFNIVKYNVISQSGKGPDIYGTEPWHFYVRNLLINFNFWFPLAFLSLPLVLLVGKTTALGASNRILFRNILLLSPFYIWFLIFTIQPHKEERFMYPVYPCIALNAAISLHLILVGIGSEPQKSTSNNTIGQIKLLFVAGFISVAVGLGIWRSAGLATAYSAPLRTYRALHDQPTITNNPNKIFNICVGKEWYRFPSSYHLPANMRLKFIKSEFSGLLPGEFSEETSSFGNPFPAARIIPLGMNDQNIEDPGKHTDLRNCHFLVDSHFAGQGGGLSELEPNFINYPEHWEPIECLDFLDTSGSHLFARLFWIPDSTYVPSRLRRRWWHYCLLRNRQHST